MKKFFQSSLTLLGSLLLLFTAAACSSDDDPAGETLPDDPFHFEALPDTIYLEAGINSKSTLAFRCDGVWKAESDATWLTIAPRVGIAGDANITIMANETNVTGANRCADLTLTSGTTTHTIVVKQTWANVIRLEQTEYEFTAEGGLLTFNFSTNIDGYFLLSGSTSGLAWIKPKKDANPKRGMNAYSYELTVLANENRADRSAEFNILVVDHDDHNKVLLTSPTIIVRQKGLPVDTSTDYSADKTSLCLQQHTKGNGVPIVLMGDGFADVDIASGRYDEVMKKAMENLFTEEPAASLREWFDVYMVYAVSANNAFGPQYSTCFGTHPDAQSGGIQGNEQTVMGYVLDVPALSSLEMLGKTLAIVIINSTTYGGVTGMAYDFGQGVTDLGMVFCPIVDGLEAERFRQVLVHESIGHGLAKLYDEYAYEAQGPITASGKAQVERFHSYGWAANVSLTSDRGKVPWTEFLADERYLDPDNYGEVLSVYEGAATYWTGAWRPTVESMMHSNKNGFNAPSRRAIYERVMRTGLGDSWTPNYEEFVTFDQAHLPKPANAAARRAQMQEERYMQPSRPLPPPYEAGRVQFPSIK